MTGARTGTLASLRGAIERVEAQTHMQMAGRIALGHASVDATLQGGLAVGAVHEVFAEGQEGATATGFVAGLAHRVMNRRALLWVRQDFISREAGELAMSGFVELGLDPSRIIVVYVRNADMALRVAADGLACNGLGAVVAEMWGQPKSFDLVASRKLTLAAGRSGVTGLLLRLAAVPDANTAETRWIVCAARSPPGADWQAWGEPMFDVQLVRNRHGSLGRWFMEWNSDACLFRQPATYPQLVAAAPADRPLQAAHAPILRPQRRIQSG